MGFALEQLPIGRLAFPGGVARNPSHISKKFFSNCFPSGVKIDSGWNCTPWIGYSRWRRPMISFSAVSAVISRTSGTSPAARSANDTASPQTATATPRIRPCRRAGSAKSSRASADPPAPPPPQKHPQCTGAQGTLPGSAPRAKWRITSLRNSRFARRARPRRNANLLRLQRRDLLDRDLVIPLTINSAPSSPKYCTRL